MRAASNTRVSVCMCQWHTGGLVQHGAKLYIQITCIILFQQDVPDALIEIPILHLENLDKLHEYGRMAWIFLVFGRSRHEEFTTV